MDNIIEINSRAERELKNVQYITNESGERTAVIVPIEDYEELLEDLHVTRVAEETKNEPRRLLINPSAVFTLTHPGAGRV